VFQEPRLLPWRTALDNVAAPLRAQGVGKGEARQRAAGWLARVGLAGFEHYHPAELSGGMAQRVSVARALSVQPAILLMDEPFTGMDATLRSSLMVTLQQILKEGRTTVVYVTDRSAPACRPHRGTRAGQDPARARPQRPPRPGPGLARQVPHSDLVTCPPFPPSIDP
jgi:ABC-type nitrate/sulfonate/bicarbonate transport system ATPase subunit